jgi:acyl dehydratase
MPTNVYELDELRTKAGTELGPTEWLPINQDRINTFADATDDHQWIHVDEQRACSGPFGRTVAHGYLTLALLVPLFQELLEIKGAGMSVNYGLNKARFPAPVPVSSRIRLSGLIAAAEDVRGDGVQIVLDFTVEVEGSHKPACVAQCVYRFYR